MLDVRMAARRTVLSTEYLVLNGTCLRAARLAAIVAFILATPWCWGAEPTSSDPVKAGKDALSSGSRFPWYDRRQDDVRRLNVVPREAPNDRGTQWTASPTTAPAKTTATRSRWGMFASFLQWAGITALVLLLGLIAYLIATSFLKDEVSEATSVRKVVESRRDADRVEALPFQVRATTGDFLAEASRLYQAGKYSEAIVYLFSFELVELDRHHVIRLAKGKTNRQYVRETRQRPLLRTILETTMVAFEDAFFGNKTLSREAFERSWNRVNEFRMELERQEQVAA
jgi:hypothetical protein